MFLLYMHVCGGRLPIHHINNALTSNYACALTVEQHLDYKMVLSQWVTSAQRTGVIFGLLASCYSFLSCSLIDVLHHDRKLYLVFEYVDYDLKKYMDKHAPTGIPVHKVKVILNNKYNHSVLIWCVLHSLCPIIIFSYISELFVPID